MNAPWLARLLAGGVDYWCDVWYTFRPNVNEFWDTVAPKFRDLPGLSVSAGADTRVVENSDAQIPGRAGEFHFHLMRVCPVCASHIGAPCTTADGKITGPHKRRRVPA